MGKIVTKAIKRVYKDLIKQVIKDLGEPILIYGTPEVADCPDCLFDRVTGKSKNIFDSSFVAPTTIFDVVINPQSFTNGRCPVCKGEGRLFDYTPKTVRAIVKWRIEDSEMERMVAGDEGSNLVRIKAKKSFYETIRDCEYAMIDGVKCVLVKPPVIRGLGQQDELVIAYLQAVSVGGSIKE